MVISSFFIFTYNIMPAGFTIKNIQARPLVVIIHRRSAEKLYETAGSGSFFGSSRPMARATKGKQATTVDPRHTRPIIWYE
jgi:hypothetical protein